MSAILDEDELSKVRERFRMAGIPPRSLVGLIVSGFRTLEDIAQARDDDLRQCRHVGRNSVTQIRAAVARALVRQEPDDELREWQAYGHPAAKRFRALGVPRGFHLAHAGYYNLEDIAAASDTDLLAVGQIGPKKLKELRAFLARALHRQVCPTCEGRGWLPGSPS